jgi:hypothetical protein
MKTGYRDGNGREECTGIRLDEQTTMENFGNRKALKDATNRMIMIYTLILGGGAIFHFTDKGVRDQNGLETTDVELEIVGGLVHV